MIMTHVKKEFPQILKSKNWIKHKYRLQGDHILPTACDDVS